MKGALDMTVEEALEFIHTRRHGGPDLARMRTVLDRLGDPDRQVKYVHVAGTNGKGSVTAMCASVLRAAGYRVGMFTSPYVRRFNERIRVDGEDIPDAELAAVTERVKSALGEFEDQVAEFETVTLIGLTYFARRGCDIAVLEVGMGGVHDATNVIETSETAVFTAIGLDHTQYLGDTPEAIAGVKAGIVKRGCRGVAYMDPGGVIADACRALDVKLTLVDFDKLTVRSMDARGAVFDFDGLEGLRIPLAGTYQPGNAALAVTALRVLRERGWSISDGDIRRGLETVSWPGRFEAVRERPVFILDGGHNPPAVEATAGSLRELYPGRKFVFLFGVMRDKDVTGIMGRLLPLAERFVCVAPPAPRALPAEELARMLRERGAAAETAGTVGEGARLAMERAGEDGAVVALGSLYILEEARAAAADWSKTPT